MSMDSKDNASENEEIEELEEKTEPVTDEAEEFEEKTEPVTRESVGSEPTATSGERTSAFAPREIFEWVETLILYFAIAISVILIFFTHSPVVGDSMYPTLHNGDVLIIRRFAYTPENGDIIVCQSESYGLEKPLVKRIIATEGQTVSINYENWTVTVDGEVLNEDYVNFISGRPMNPSNYLEDTFTVPKGMLFVMGDNRNNSTDSRSASVGLIDERYVLGKAVIKVLPLRDITIY